MKYEKLSKNLKQIEKILAKDNIKDIETCAILVSANNTLYSVEYSKSVNTLVLCLNFLKIRYKISAQALEEILKILDKEMAGNILSGLGASND